MWFGVSGTRNKGYPSITLILGIKFWNSGFRLSDGWGGGDIALNPKPMERASPGSSITTSTIVGVLCDDYSIKLP